jgi:hypothetical protein
MPIAKDFLQTFGRSSLAGERWVLTGNILTYARDHHGLSAEAFFGSGLDIEAFHSEVEAGLIEAFSRLPSDENARLDVMSMHATYVQLVSVFAATINLIQNGPVSEAHKGLAKSLCASDAVITFNWDTLMDRALAETTDWATDFGYGFQPWRIYRNGWETPPGGRSDVAPTLLKLHGSSNWLTSYLIPDYKSHSLSLTQSAPTDRVHVFECALNPYPTWKGRFMAGYERFSYGYYPPHLPDDPGKAAPDGHVFVQASYNFPWMPKGRASDEGLVSSPLIIPPVQKKTYELFGNLFDDLWKQAADALALADEIALVGYSFPVTDVHSLELFKKAFCRRTSLPRVTVVDPFPDRALQTLCRDCGIPRSSIRVFSGTDGYFSTTFDINQLWSASELR